MKKVIISILFILFVCHLTAQKNAIYSNLGLLHASINYERTIHESIDKKPKSLITLFAGKGKQLFFFSGEYYNFFHLGAMLSALFGKHKSHFEAGFGGGPIWAETNTDIETKKLYARINLGYRFENEHILFRIGSGFPEITYLGFGVRF